MPTLEWIGKDKVVNHHLEVPYRVLEEQYTYNADRSENMIIRGDNLEALKALLPQYERRVKCIYIDPPYNTGNEGWVYNDNVNDPRIKKWLGEVVGREGEDLSRHDKWLCMMYPRLKLLQRLLAENGVIFISIDDNELCYLKSICDEIFGASCFVSTVSWQRTYSTRNDSKGIVSEVEHILVYSKRPGWNPNKLPRTYSMNAKYKNPDNDPLGDWRSDNAYAADANTHQGMVYAIQHPFTGKMLYPSNGSHWRYQQDEMLAIMCGWCSYKLHDLNDAHERAVICGVPDDEVRQGVKAIVLAESLEISKEKAATVLKRGQWPRFFFSKGGQGGIARKTYLGNVGGTPPTNLWQYADVGHTDEAAKILRAIFDGKAAFDTPKPPRLIERILQIAGDKDTLILDSFAGSGTTAHAVLNMNKADGGHRRFILVEMMDYAESITAERVKRVIDGYGEGKNAVESTGGDFTFYDLGPVLLLPNGNLNEDVGAAKIREYVYFMETKTSIEPDKEDEPYYMGVHLDSAYYFYYERDSLTTLSRDFLGSIKTKAGQYTIYADQCTLSQTELERWHITFKKIPRDISKL